MRASVTLIAEATDTPVWFLFGATVALAVITFGLAIAAILALRQLGFAVQDLEEVKRDRHVQVFADLGRRWDGPEMVEALRQERLYNVEQLRKLFARAYAPPSRNRFKEWLAKRAASKTVVLLRIPNFFENLSLIVRAGSLDIKLVSQDYGTVANDSWEKWKPAIMELRETDKQSYAEFQWLVDRMAKLPDA
jgi:hypothetical protein